MPKIRDSDSENNKDKSGDNTSATNYAFLIKFCLTISFTPSISFLTSFSIKLSNLITRVSDVPAGIGADIVFPSVEPEHLRGRSLSAIRPMTVTEYNSIHADNYKTEKNTGNIILIMIVATICLIKVIRAAKKSD